MSSFTAVSIFAAAILLLLAGLYPLVRSATRLAAEPRRGWPFALFLAALAGYEVVIHLFLPDLATIWPEVGLAITAVGALRARAAKRSTTALDDTPFKGSHDTAWDSADSGLL